MTSNPGMPPASATVGSSGATAERFALLMPSAWMRPASTWGMAARAMLKSACTCPPHGLGERRPAAFVRNVHDVDSGGLAEELEREMTGCPVACGGKCQLAVQRPRVGD